MGTATQVEGILQYVRQRLLTLPGMGLVPDFQPIATDPQDIASQLGTPGDVHYWTVTVVSTTEEWANNMEIQCRHDVALKGYREVGNPAETEPAFRALVAAIRNTFRQSHTIGGVTNAELFGPMQTPSSGEHRLLAGTFLCHYAECHAIAQERLLRDS